MVMQGKKLSHPQVFGRPSTLHFSSFDIVSSSGTWRLEIKPNKLIEKGHVLGRASVLLLEVFFFF
jgi:hypothetical protein